VKLTVLKNNSSLFSQTWSDEEIEEGFELFVGRSEDCHVFLDDPLISRHHFVVKFIDGKWQVDKLTDLGIISVSGRVLESTLDLRGSESIAFPPYTIMIEGISQGSFGGDLLSSTQANNLTTTAPLTASLNLPTQSGMNDDLPAIEELDATEVLTTDFEMEAASVSKAQPRVSERTQELAEGLYEEAAPEETFSATEES
jgi:hypothetical protein